MTSAGGSRWIEFNDPPERLGTGATLGGLVEEIVAMVMVFGGGTLLALAFSPIGRAIAARIRGEPPVGLAAGTDPAVLEELDRMRLELTEVHERLDFAERLLAARPETAALKRGEE